MMALLRRLLLRFLRVPPRPEAPAGDPGVIRTFRAAPNYFRYKVAIWAFGQLVALSGLVGALIMLHWARGRLSAPIDLLITQITYVELAAWVTFLAQLPVTYAILRLDYTMRWYLLSDRSLRIREGVMTVREQTMTYANVQQIVVRQNPLQRLCGIHTLVVSAAGGGGGSADARKGKPSGGHAHEARFEGIDNAEQVRSLIRERVRMHRDAGLGDTDEPEDHGEAEHRGALAPADTGAPPTAQPAIQAVDPLAAARAVLEEARALRASLSAR